MVSVGSIPDWSKVLARFDEGQANRINDTHDHFDGSAMELDPVSCNLQNRNFQKGGKGFNLDFMELTTCQSLLNLLCWIPKGCESSRSLSTYLTHVLNIER